MADYATRALAAWYRAGNTGSAPVASLVTARGKDYVVLRKPGAARLAAVYRVRNDGMLKGLRRWPRELEGGPE